MKKITSTLIIAILTCLNLSGQDSDENIKNNLTIYPFQLFQKTLTIGYERALSDNIGAKASYYNNLDGKYQEIELHGRYYFLRTDPATLELSFLTFNDLSYDMFGFLSAGSLFDFHDSNLQYSGRMGIGGHVITTSNFNIETYLGCGYYQIKNAPHFIDRKKETNTGVEVNLRIAVGYRF
jgi:hypothetical protein